MSDQFSLPPMNLEDIWRYNGLSLPEDPSWETLIEGIQLSFIDIYLNEVILPNLDENAPFNPSVGYGTEPGSPVSGIGPNGQGIFVGYGMPTVQSHLSKKPAKQITVCPSNEPIAKIEFYRSAHLIYTAPNNEAQLYESHINNCDHSNEAEFPLGDFESCYTYCNKYGVTKIKAYGVGDRNISVYWQATG